MKCRTKNYQTKFKCSDKWVAGQHLMVGSPQRRERDSNDSIRYHYHFMVSWKLKIVRVVLHSTASFVLKDHHRSMMASWEFLTH